jgi:uncharacterized protein YcgI (DUF1989 family)
MSEYGTKRTDIILQPVTGKALPVYRGEVLRIVQIEGQQCVDFNAYNLHDYKEFLEASNTRGHHGFRPRKGDLLWSQYSRNRPMYAILEMPPTCVTDVARGGRCTASTFQSTGLGLHTNCQDTFAESIREYGLSPDDVHDSFNMWYNTEWDSAGETYITHNTGKKGDTVDLLALFDTLAVPVVCGSGDVRASSNYALKPIQVQVFEASAKTLSVADRLATEYGRFQRTLKDFRLQTIKTDRELRPDPSYKPEFLNFPLVYRSIEVKLNQEEHARLQALYARGFGRTEGEALIAGFFIWYQRNRQVLSLKRVRQ